MKIVNFGSINIDYVYSVDHFVQPGETLSSRELNRYPGGKGFNQSVALANAGAKVYHAGKIGRDGLWLKDRLKRFGVDTKFVEAIESPSGHAIIQVNAKGENAIVLYGGANQTINIADAEKVIPVDTTAAGDTFIGFFLSDLINGENAETALRTACKAAALCVTKPGAADSIPFRSELKR